MPRCTTAAIALFLFASAATATNEGYLLKKSEEPRDRDASDRAAISHLRIPVASAVDPKYSMMKAMYDEDVNDDNDPDDDDKDDDDDGKKKKKDFDGGFQLEKGMSCEGGFKKGKGKGKKCKGGLKGSFVKSAKAQDMASAMAQAVFEETLNLMPSSMEDFNPESSDEETFQALLELNESEDDLLLLDDEALASKTVEFGGFVKAGFGCKVSFEKKGGKLVKKATCEFGGMKGMGMKPKGETGEDSEVEMEFYF